MWKKWITFKSFETSCGKAFCQGWSPCQTFFTFLYLSLLYPSNYKVFFMTLPGDIHYSMKNMHRGKVVFSTLEHAFRTKDLRKAVNVRKRIFAICQEPVFTIAFIFQGLFFRAFRYFPLLLNILLKTMKYLFRVAFFAFQKTPCALFSLEHKSSLT